ncbi:hypothetical protein ACM66B_006083 [Microbotryomycetes sp. NB124-2]
MFLTRHSKQDFAVEYLYRQSSVPCWHLEKSPPDDLYCPKGRDCLRSHEVSGIVVPFRHTFAQHVRRQHKIQRAQSIFTSILTNALYHPSLEDLHGSAPGDKPNCMAEALAALEDQDEWTVRNYIKMLLLAYKVYSADEPDHEDVQRLASWQRLFRTYPDDDGSPDLDEEVYFPRQHLISHEEHVAQEPDDELQRKSILARFIAALVQDVLRQTERQERQEDHQQQQQPTRSSEGHDESDGTVSTVVATIHECLRTSARDNRLQREEQQQQPAEFREDLGQTDGGFLSGDANNDDEEVASDVSFCESDDEDDDDSFSSDTGDDMSLNESVDDDDDVTPGLSEAGSDIDVDSSTSSEGVTPLATSALNVRNADTMSLLHINDGLETLVESGFKTDDESRTTEADSTDMTTSDSDTDSDDSSDDDDDDSDDDDDDDDSEDDDDDSIADSEDELIAQVERISASPRKNLHVLTKMLEKGFLV